jgi:polyphenol oxidase
MSNQSQTWIENDLGFHQIFNNQFLIFFGKKLTTLDLLQKHYPHFQFLSVNQIHSDICVEAGSSHVSADAHYTDKLNQALVIKTADCLPVLIFNSATERILSVHAGWRGVVNQILSKSIRQSQIASPTVFVGPHIQQNSFEIDQDVFQKLYATAKSYQTDFHDSDLFYNRHTKSFLNLNYLVNLELKSLMLNTFDTHNLDLDTVTNTNFNSYRREKSNAGRNLSFIVRIS